MPHKLKTPKELGVTARQFKNLCKLITFVRTKVEPPKFKIHWWNTDKDGNDVDEPAKAVYECGTTACFCGYGPLAGIKPKPRDTWYSYQKREFGTDGDDWGENPAQRLFNLLFEGTHENSRDAAVRRGAYFLVNGIPDAYLQKWEAPKSFRAPWKLIEEAAR
jgi:hypothetical protein